MLPFELLCRDTDSLEISNLYKDFIESRLRDSAFSSNKDTGKTFEKKLPKAEFDTLNILLKNKDIIVEKADIDLRLPMFFFVITKRFGFKIVLLNLNLLSIEGKLMLHSYFFARNITSKNSEIN